jgi:hypothetical protein
VNAKHRQLLFLLRFPAQPAQQAQPALLPKLALLAQPALPVQLVMTA